MKKKFRLILAGTCMVIGLVGCGKVSKNISYTYSVSTGDKVKLTVDTADNYSITKDLPFTITKDGSTLSQGKFITKENYAEIITSVKTDEKATIINSGNKDDDEFIFWSYNNSEYNYAILINDSDTGVIIGNPISEESARECFEKIKISKVK